MVRDSISLFFGVGILNRFKEGIEKTVTLIYGIRDIRVDVWPDMQF